MPGHVLQPPSVGTVVRLALPNRTLRVIPCFPFPPGGFSAPLHTLFSLCFDDSFPPYSCISALCSYFTQTIPCYVFFLQYFLHETWGCNCHLFYGDSLLMGSVNHDLTYSLPSLLMYVSEVQCLLGMDYLPLEKVNFPYPAICRKFKLRKSYGLVLTNWSFL